jgi:hypothetical protein
MAANLFAKAKAEAAPVEKTKVKKDDKREVTIPGTHQLAIVKGLAKTLKTIEATLTEKVKLLAKSEFTAQAALHKVRPDSFRGIDKTSKATYYISKRSTASPLTEEEQAALKAAEIPFATEVLIPGRYVVNPEVMDDQDLLEKVSKALSKIPGGEKFITWQAEQSAAVVSEETVDKVFELGLASKFMGMVTTIGVKPSTDVTDLKKSLDSVKELLVAKKEG